MPAPPVPNLMKDIQRLAADEARDALPQLVTLLQDAVHDGASIGFTQPLPADVASA